MGKIIIVLTCIHIIHIIIIMLIQYIQHPNKNKSNLYTNPIQTNPNQIHPNTNPNTKYQTSIQSNPIQSNSLKPCGRSIHNTNNTLTSSIITLFHQISIHQSNPIIKYSICIICIICIIIQDTTII